MGVGTAYLGVGTVYLGVGTAYLGVGTVKGTCFWCRDSKWGLVSGVGIVKHYDFFRSQSPHRKQVPIYCPYTGNKSNLLSLHQKQVPIYCPSVPTLKYTVPTPEYTVPTPKISCPYTRKQAFNLPSLH